MSELENKLNNIAIEKERKIIPENIKKGVSIFGVVGNMSSGTDTSDATATANDIKAGTTAYTATGKAEGTLTFDKFTPDYPNCLDKVKQIKGVTPLENPYFIEALTNENVNFKIYNGVTYSNIKSWITEIPEVNTANVTNMNSMFHKCTNLTSIPQLNTSNVTDMDSMFQECTNLTTIPLLDTSKVTNMQSMFNGCANLTSVPLLNTSKVTNMSYMFQGCANLTSILQLDTSNVTEMIAMFTNCMNLTTVPLFNTSNVTNMNGMFTNCPSLSDESLNNILRMCINAIHYKVNQYRQKTLKELDLSQEQATRCQSLSNWQAFLDAGWTSGY